MRLLHRDFRFFFEFQENEQNLLVVENPALFYRIVRELCQDIPEEENRMVLSEDDRPVRLKDCLLCSVNPLTIMLNERRLLNGLYEKMQKEIGSSELLLEHNKAVTALNEYAYQLLQESDFELTFTEQIDVSALLKFLNIRFAEKQETLIERLTDYIHAAAGILNIHCFVFVNFSSYLTEYEWKKLQEYACYQKIHILLLESRQPESIEHFAKVVVIDKDLCEILLKG